MYGWQVEEERYAATQAEAHREWHRNSGEKYGCPWDACEPPEPDHCNVCGDYVDDDGRCARSEDEHALLVAEQMSEQLAAGPGRRTWSSNPIRGSDLESEKSAPSM